MLLVAYVGTADTSVGGLTERAFLVPPLAWIIAVGSRLAAARPD